MGRGNSATLRNKINGISSSYNPDASRENEWGLTGFVVHEVN